MPIYAVTGASGQLGRLAVEQLLARGIPAPDVVALVRTPSKAADLAERGVQVRAADYAQPQTLSGALAGVDRLLLISSSEAGQRFAHHSNVIQAATTAGVSRIVYTSMLDAENSTNPLAGEHRATEQALRGAGVDYTVLRNGWYTETTPTSSASICPPRRSSARPAPARSQQPPDWNTPRPPRPHCCRTRQATGRTSSAAPPSI